MLRSRLSQAGGLWLLITLDQVLSRPVHVVFVVDRVAVGQVTV